jgi:putative Mg2+ transporter-C (MgtC) family protein
MDMPLTASWAEIAARLALSFLAGGLIGLNREERGHTAGLRTTLLVCLAACVAMVQVNMLLPLAGKTPSGFSVMDLMRLPLGILTGMGFIGGGAILKRGSLVVGVTTAATLWMTTVIGLCFGGGQLWLGAIATALTIFILSVMKAVDAGLPKMQRGTLEVTTSTKAGLEITAEAVGARNVAILERRWLPDQHLNMTSFEISYRGEDRPLLSAFAGLASQPGAVTVKWARIEENS